MFLLIIYHNVIIIMCDWMSKYLWDNTLKCTTGWFEWRPFHGTFECIISTSQQSEWSYLFFICWTKVWFNKVKSKQKKKNTKDKSTKKITCNLTISEIIDSGLLNYWKVIYTCFTSWSHYHFRCALFFKNSADNWGIMEDRLLKHIAAFTLLRD